MAVVSSTMILSLAAAAAAAALAPSDCQTGMERRTFSSAMEDAHTSAQTSKKKKRNCTLLRTLATVSTSFFAAWCQ